MFVALEHNKYSKFCLIYKEFIVKNFVFTGLFNYKSVIHGIGGREYEYKNYRVQHKQRQLHCQGLCNSSLEEFLVKLPVVRCCERFAPLPNKSGRITRLT